MKYYQFDKQRVVDRDSNDKIMSIMPIYEENNNKYNEFYDILNQLKNLSNKHKSIKFVVEINGVPEQDYRTIQDEIGFGNNYQDHVGKFFFNVACHFNGI